MDTYNPNSGATDWRKTLLQMLNAAENPTYELPVQLGGTFNRTPGSVNPDNINWGFDSRATYGPYDPYAAGPTNPFVRANPNLAYTTGAIYGYGQSAPPPDRNTPTYRAFDLLRSYADGSYGGPYG